MVLSSCLATSCKGLDVRVPRRAAAAIASKMRQVEGRFRNRRQRGIFAYLMISKCSLAKVLVPHVRVDLHHQAFVTVKARTPRCIISVGSFNVVLSFPYGCLLGAL